MKDPKNPRKRIFGCEPADFSKSNLSLNISGDEDKEVTHNSSKERRQWEWIIQIDINSFNIFIERFLNAITQ